jgi:hypothetical protein
MVTGEFFPGVKDGSGINITSISAEVKKAWILM